MLLEHSETECHVNVVLEQAGSECRMIVIYIKKSNMRLNVMWLPDLKMSQMLHNKKHYNVMWQKSVSKDMKFQNDKLQFVLILDILPDSAVLPLTQKWTLWQHSAYTKPSLCCRNVDSNEEHF